MAKPKRHLHRDYHAAFCGLDAEHIAMTYDRGAATCKKCLEAATAADEAAEREREKEEAAAAEEEDARTAALSRGIGGAE